MQISRPELSITDTLAACINGASRDAYKQRLVMAENEILRQAELYCRLGEQGTLYQITALLSGSSEDPVVLADLKKSELIRLYEYYLRKKKTGRELYDTLLGSSDKCPFCGGLGRPRNLDHYLPKAFFSQFSILPYNLIPACRDCNMEGKGDAYAQTQEDQILHPFLDRSHFFEQQWIFARYIQEDSDQPGVFEFYTSPPSQWSDIDKARVNKHFCEFDIGARYSVKAAQEISDVFAQRRLFSCVDEFKRTNLEPVIANASFANYWKRVMYIGLLNTL
ncbi:hypothetical Protein YC6258_02842 [Gynuella sunshinyii YC6258]|uniref:HNH nuclease domain-containing protein n=2 Tax=Gynuella sunshinyii TaxID=1445505 RepID=A0A0C5V5Z9_9GAMM|nr:hypothetical Protein YC6258_02842 [Gynuella sunshinyii YC6258]